VHIILIRIFKITMSSPDDIEKSHRTIKIKMDEMTDILQKIIRFDF